MLAVGYVLFFILGLFQFFATIVGVQALLGIHWIFAAFIAGILAWMPIIGSISGAVAAHYVWGWSWFAAILLFFGPLIVAGAFVVGSLELDKARAR
jgi:hypothetical protein